MENKIDKEGAGSRRIFINHNENFLKLFSFHQHKDGSIYASWPSFNKTQWISSTLTKSGPQVSIVKRENDGKLSIHGSGMSTFRDHTEQNAHQMIIHGNLLLSKRPGVTVAGIRHLFTAFMMEPYVLLSNSPAFNRKSDYALHSNQQLNPFAFIFIAVPRLGYEYEFKFSLKIDEIDTVPSDFLGLHNFPMVYHGIIWFAYRTKDMEDWPKVNLITYDNGYTIPVFIGKGKGEMIVQYRQPHYLIEDNKLTIDCSRT
jgi:hypothetical protein